jgi:hypothetical protein
MNQPVRIQRPWLIVALCLLPFLPGIVGPFMLDDRVNLQPVLAALQDGSWWTAIVGNTSGFLGRPLAMASFAANSALFGEFPLSFKLANILIHGLNGLLVYALARRLYPHLSNASASAQASNVAMATAAIWLLHPLQVSSVLYVVQRMTLLATTGMLLALLVAARYLCGSDFSRGHSVRTLIVVAACSGIALLSKEIAILVPVLIGLLAVFIATPEDQDGCRNRRLFVSLAAWLPMAIYACLLLGYWDNIVGGYERRDFTLGQRLATEPVVLLDYLRSILWPDIRHMGLYLDDQPIHHFGDPASLAATGFWLLAGVMGFAGRRRFPLPAFAVLWFLACHLLESSVIGLELAFEHRNYLALFGISLLFADLLRRLCLSRERLLPWAAGVVCLLLAVCTGLRAGEWADEGRFLALESQRHPHSFKALDNLGEYYFRHGDKRGMARATTLLADRFPENFFAQSQRIILIACRIMPGAPDWPTLRRAALRNPDDPWASTSLPSIANNVDPEGCDGIDRRQLDAFFSDLLADYRRLDLHAAAANALVAKAWLRRIFGFVGGYVDGLSQAATENPAANAASLELLAAYRARGDQAQMQALAARLAPRLHEGAERQQFARLMDRRGQPE